MWMLEVELTGTKVKEQQHERAVLPCIIGTHSKTNSVRYISKPCLWGHSSFSLLSLAWLVLSASPLHPGVDLYWPTCRASGEKPGDSLQCRGALYHCPVHSPSLAIAILQPQGSFWAIISAGLWAGQQGAICSLLWKHKLSPWHADNCLPFLSKQPLFLSITQQSRCCESFLASTFSLRTAMSFLPPLSLCQLLLMELTSLLLQTLHPSPAAYTSVSEHTAPLKKVHLKL